MNVRRFTGRTSREAMQKVKEAFGNDAIVLSNKAAPEGGVEIMAMAPEGMAAIEKQAARQERLEPVDESSKAPKGGARQAVASLATTVQEDVRQLAMSTLSFQDYVRERMLRRRQAALKARMEPELAPTPEDQLAQRVGSNGQGAAKAPALAQPRTRAVVDEPLDLAQPMPGAPVQVATRAPVAEQLQAAPSMEHQAQHPQASAPQRPGLWSDPADLTMSQMVAQTPKPTPGNARPSATAVAAAQAATPEDGTREALAAAQAANASMLGELRAMRAMMKERFETIAFIERLQRTPSQATMAQRLLDGGFSPVLIRKMIDGMPADVVTGQRDPMDWAGMVLERNLNTAEGEPNIEDQGGIFALIGATGVGKTTSTAKLAALFAAKHGAHNLGLITLDAYRMGAHEQLRAYGRILNVPVHIAHDRAALEDLLELLAGKKMILIDTAGMPQRDARTREMLEMVSHPSIRKLLVVNASAQGDAIEDVLVAYQAHKCAGVVLSKLDEAVKLGPALDALIRHKTKILGVANGQRVPEDWHRLTATSLVHRALRASLNPAFRLDPNEVSLILAANALSDTAAANPTSAA